MSRYIVLDTLTQRIIENAIVTIPDEEHEEECRAIVSENLVDVFSLKEPPTETQVSSYVRKIPYEIRELAARWDWLDTEVRDKLYTWLKDVGWMYE